MLFTVLPIAAASYSAVIGDAVHRRVINASPRTQVVDGREYSAWTLKHPILREKNTGRFGIALQRGYTMRADWVVTQPEWMRVQFFRKTDGEPGRLEWRRFSKLDIVGTASVDYLSRRAGLLRTERLMSCNVDLAALTSKT